MTDKEYQRFLWLKGAHPLQTQGYTKHFPIELVAAIIAILILIGVFVFLGNVEATRNAECAKKYGPGTVSAGPHSCNTAIKELGNTEVSNE